MFRSTGSYEPDQVKMFRPALAIRFDPQALTSLTGMKYGDEVYCGVSIHRLLRA